MDDYGLLIDLHQYQSRQGPGGDWETQRAIALARLDPSRSLKIVDIGCGTGASTLVLARLPRARVTAIDLFPEFLNILESRAEMAGLGQAITSQVGSMETLDLDEEAYDVLWAEGSIYNMGFGAGIQAWRRFLKPGGILAVSDITWLRNDRPKILENYWIAQYPEIDTAAAKIAQLNDNGYETIGYFSLPQSCWLEQYYQPLEQSFPQFLDRHHHSPEAQAIVAAETQEIAFYHQYSPYYSYGFYVAKKWA